ncbi:MAG: SusE domain-containing protein [Prevotella sp.]|nr:SusE domain-containing protein [Prevotella sp.]
MTSKIINMLCGCLISCGFAATLVSCADDNDSNPTLLRPTTFTLNETPYASSVIDLATSTGIPFTWNQPDFGFPIVTQYQFQILPHIGQLIDYTDGDFVTIDDVFTTANGTLNTNKLTSAINEKMGWTELTEEEAASLPETVQTIVRIAAHAAGTDTIYSNAVSLTLVPSLVVAPSFPEFIYMMGNFNGWSDPVALRSPAQDGLYSCFNWLDGGFKFRPNEDNWDGDWGQDPSGAYGTLVADGEEDCNDAGKSFPDQAQPAGFYQVNVDMTTMTWSISPITSVSIIGGFNGWADDVEMTYNADGGYWECTTSEVEGEFKFRANHDWAINWGGSVNALTQDGSNLSLDAGTYTFKLYITHEGDSHVEITQ